MKLLAILADTFREALARKTIIGFFVISNFFLVVALIAFIAAKDSILSQKVQTPGVAAAMTMTIPDIINGIELVIARLMYAPAMLLSIFATASIVPNALEKGSIDLLLSKPISRTEILVGKFLGGSLMVFLNVAYYIIGMWFIVSLTTGYWNAGFLTTIFPVTFAFMVLYSIAILLGVVVRSSALSIIIIYFLFIIIIPILTGREQLFAAFIKNETVQSIMTGLYYILPKTDDLANMMSSVIQHQSFDWMPIWSSALFAAAMFIGAIFLFRKKDF